LNPCRLGMQDKWPSITSTPLVDDDITRLFLLPLLVLRPGGPPLRANTIPARGHRPSALRCRDNSGQHPLVAAVQVASAALEKHASSCQLFCSFFPLHCCKTLPLV
jgi:hypothetical protein